jgi:hypothetical protein
VDHPNCGGGEKHCIRAERNAVVHFVAPGGEAFEIQASPFRAGNLASRDGKVDATIDAPPNPGKAYPFSILGAPKCPPLDPWIIVE